jgi:hypothetical protein
VSLDAAKALQFLQAPPYMRAVEEAEPKPIGDLPRAPAVPENLADIVI